MPAHDPLSLVLDKQCVILDIGAKYTKFGFSGEPSPRCIIPTETISGDTGKTVKVFQYADIDELRTNLIDFIHVLFFKYALIHPKEKRVVVVESLLCPTVLKDTLASVLFDHFEVTSVIFVPSHVVSLYTLGVNTALVVDIGYQEATVIPVYEGIPVLKAWQALPLGSKLVQNTLRDRLFGKLKRIVGTTEEAIDDPSCLNDEIIEDILVKGCFVTKLQRSTDSRNGVKPDTLPPEFTYRVDGDKIINVESSDREFCYDVLFEQDGDQLSLSTMILDAILLCSVDMRRPLAENILVIGGTAMAKGLKARLQEELLSLLKEERYSKRLFVNTFKFHDPPALPNYVAWLGGSICGATDMITMKSLTREAYNEMNNRVPDWSNLVNRNDMPIPKTTLQL
ncbi:actin-related protein 10 [Planococcus citri]|uniref:actin-related protein 10 n=1 Tax=Planococcus citri TaxID=170843 RepID=UPI0031F72D8D